MPARAEGQARRRSTGTRPTPCAGTTSPALRRGEGRAGGDRRVPAAIRKRFEGWAPACRRGSCSTARPEPARRCSRRPSPTSPAPTSTRSERVGVRRDVRRPRRRAHPQAVRGGAQERAGDRVHRRARRRRAARTGGAATTASTTRRSTSCSSSSTASAAATRSSSWAPPTASRISIPRCCAPAASTARCSSRRPTSHGREEILRVHTRSQAARPPTSTSPGRPPDLRADRRRSRQRRNEAAIFAAANGIRTIRAGRLRGRDGARRRRAPDSAGSSPRRRSGSSPTTRPGTR